MPGARHLLLSVRYDLEVVQEPHGRWAAAIAGYWYAILHADERELLAYHWHPRGVSAIVWPHLHVSAPVAPLDLSRAHLPTGPVSLPAVLRCAIADLGVRPLRQGWAAVLADAESAVTRSGE